MLRKTENYGKESIIWGMKMNEAEIRYLGEEGRAAGRYYNEENDPSPSELKEVYEDGLRTWLDKSNCPWTLPSDVSNRITLAGFVQKMISEGRHLQSYPNLDQLSYQDVNVGPITISDEKDVITETKENMCYDDFLLYIRGEQQAEDVINEVELERFRKEDAKRLYGLNPAEMQEKDLLKYWENHKVLTKVYQSIYFENIEPEKPWLPEKLMAIYETCKEQLHHFQKDSITEYFSVSVENSEAFLAEMELAVRRVKTDADFLKTSKSWQKFAKGCKREAEILKQVEDFDIEGKLNEIEELRRKYKELK